MSFWHFANIIRFRAPARRSGARDIAQVAYTLPVGGLSILQCMNGYCSPIIFFSLTHKGDIVSRSPISTAFLSCSRIFDNKYCLFLVVKNLLLIYLNDNTCRVSITACSFFVISWYCFSILFLLVIELLTRCFIIVETFFSNILFLFFFILFKESTKKNRPSCAESPFLRSKVQSSKDQHFSRLILISINQ